MISKAMHRSNGWARGRCLVSKRWMTTVGIRREDPKRIWERRAPLTPPAVAELVSGGDIAVEVESCRRRAFPDHTYEAAGARLVPSLSAEVDLVLGIKEPPVSEVQRLLDKGLGKPRTWMVFSHTHKGQEYNTELLSTFLGGKNRQTLIDYELLTKEKPDGNGYERVAAFGWYAGDPTVGAGEALTMTGLALLRRGMATPLLHLPRPYTFSSIEDYKAAIAETARALEENSPEEPIVIGITGRGNVAKGARAVLEAANPVWVEGSQLREVLESDTHAGRIIAVQIDMKDYMRHDAKRNSFDREAYYANPNQFNSHFDEDIAPYLTTLINGQGWQRGFPRIMDNTQLDSLMGRPGPSGSKPQKLAAVQDITCDIKGNLEFMDRHTTIDQPYFEGPGGIMISSIDILPTELPRDASEHFSSRILPYVRQVAKGGQGSDVTETLKRGTIVDQGTITKAHEWLLPRVTEWRQLYQPADERPLPKRKVLLLGSGLVAGPAAQVLGSRSDLIVRLASNDLKQSNEMSAKYANMSGMELDVKDESATSQAVSEADVVISLLPAPMHTSIANHCIQHHKHLVTASYVSEEMQALNDQAVDAGITILGECGLDPGIDSMAAMRIIDRAKREGKRVSSFISWCGGLPELSASEVPLRYKFSWSPKAVLTAALNDARYKLNNTVAMVSGNKLLEQHFPSVELWDDLPLEGLANRDSLPYAEKYGLGPVDGLRDLFRGTLRYQGFSQLMDSFRRLGLLNMTELQQPVSSLPQLLLESMKAVHPIPQAAGMNELPSVVRDVVAPGMLEETLGALEWFGLLPSNRHPHAPMVYRAGLSPLDCFAQLLSARLSYAPGERDSTLLHHSFMLHPNGTSPSGPGQRVTASLLAYGNEEASAMATTVGKTLAFAALRVLDGKVTGRGVRRPVDRDVYEGVLDDLEEIGVKVEEKWT